MMAHPVGAVRRLADVAFPRSYKHKYMWNLAAYLDETGHYDDPNIKFVGMAGLIATADAWEQFEVEWWAILKKHDLPEGEFFHMKDFAHSRGAFIDWKGDEPRRRALLTDLFGAIKRAHAVPFGTTIPMEPFRQYPKNIQNIIGNHPYHICFMTCTVILADMMRAARAYGEKITPVFAEISDFKKLAMSAFDVLQDHHPAGDLLYSPVFRPMAEFASLQAADLVAYEAQKEAHRIYYQEPKPSRWGWTELLDIVKLSVSGFVPFIFQNDALVRIHMNNAVTAVKEAEIQVRGEMEREREERNGNQTNGI